LTALRSTPLQGLLQLQWVDNRALEGGFMNTLHRLWNDDAGQDIAEYAVMLAVILVIVVGTIRLIGSNSNNVFSSVSSSLQ
jgi:Flp pilus assembly pilin Flp